MQVLVNPIYLLRSEEPGEVQKKGIKKDFDVNKVRFLRLKGKFCLRLRSAAVVKNVKSAENAKNRTFPLDKTRCIAHARSLYMRALCARKFSLTLRVACGKMLPCEDRALWRDRCASDLCRRLRCRVRALRLLLVLRECAGVRVVARGASARSAVRKYH